jgi:hypothetical protein
MQDQDMYARTRAPAGAHEADDGGSKATIAAETAKETAKDEARTVAATAKQEAGAVVGAARSQVRRLTSQAKDQATERVRGSHNQFVDRLRAIAGEFEEMGADGNSPGKALVSDLGQRGRRVADYLADRGPEGLLSEVTDFARRRPGAFLATAVAAGFLVGRLGKGIWKAQQEEDGTRSTVDTTARVAPIADERYERVAATPQWTEPPSTVTGVAPVPPAPPAAAPVTPATAPMPPTTEPYPPGTYPAETYNDPYGATQPRGGELR